MTIELFNNVISKKVKANCIDGKIFVGVFYDWIDNAVIIDSECGTPYMINVDELESVEVI